MRGWKEAHRQGEDWTYGFPYYVRQLPLELFPWKPNKLKLLHQVHMVISYASDPKPLSSSGEGLNWKGTLSFRKLPYWKVFLFFPLPSHAKSQFLILKAFQNPVQDCKPSEEINIQKTRHQWPCKQNPNLNMKLRIQQIYKYNIHIGYDIFCWKLSLVENCLFC